MDMQEQMSHVMRKPVYAIWEQQMSNQPVWSAPLLFIA